MLAVATVVAPASAQESPRAVDSLPSRQQVEQPAPAPAANTAPRARIDASKAIRVAPCPLETSTARVTLSTISYRSPAGKAVAPQIAKVLAKVGLGTTGEQPVSAVCAIRDRANAALQKAGYIASVQIPPQTITTGELQLTVITARITEVRVHGEPGHYRDALLARIARLKALDPVNERDAERILLIAGDIPGLDVQLSLRPAGTTPGAVIGDLTIIRRRFTVLANIQNYGSRQLGRETLYVRAETYGLVTPSDVVYVGGSTTRQLKEQQVAQVGYITGVGGGGATLGARFNYAWSRPDLGQLDLRSRSLIGGFDATLPLVRSVVANLTLGGGAEAIEQRTRVYGGGVSTPLNRDKLRVAYLRMAGNARVRAGDGRDILAFSGGVELRKGLSLLGATQRGEISSTSGYTPSRFGADPQAFVVRANGTATAHLRPLSISSEARIQWTDKPLLNFEEFAVGNLTTGRGYDPGSNSGDRAVGLANEVRLDLPFIPALPIQLFGFGDIVWLRNLDIGSTERKRTLRSVGGGVRVSLPGLVVLEVTYAKPLDRALTFDDKPPPARVLASLTAQFAPQVRP